MRLTEQELKNIVPGIYRDSFSYLNGVPGLRPAEFDTYDIPTQLERLRLEDQVQRGFPEVITGKEESDDGHWPQRTFFPSIKSFLDTWKIGYDRGISQFGTNQVYNKLGFELFYLNWHPDSEFFSFGDHKGIKFMGSRADLNPIMILGDNNGMNDQSGYLNLGVNDFRTLKVLVYRKLDEKGMIEKNHENESNHIDLTKSNPKILRNDIRYYVWPGQDRFPFSSPNIIKSMDNMWTAVGISPLEIYAAVEDMGFKFPD